MDAKERNDAISLYSIVSMPQVNAVKSSESSMEKIFNENHHSFRVATLNHKVTSWKFLLDIFKSPDKRLEWEEFSDQALNTYHEHLMKTFNGNVDPKWTPDEFLQKYNNEDLKDIYMDTGKLVYDKNRAHYESLIGTLKEWSTLIEICDKEIAKKSIGMDAIKKHLISVAWDWFYDVLRIHQLEGINFKRFWSWQEAFSTLGKKIATDPLNLPTEAKTPLCNKLMEYRDSQNKETMDYFIDVASELFFRLGKEKSVQAAKNKLFSL